MEIILLAGAERARQRSAPFMAELRQAVGLRNLASKAAKPGTEKAAKAALPTFKQYRESTGLFHFKLVDGKGRLLLESAGFASAREAGQTVARLQTQGPAALGDLQGMLTPVDGVTPAEIRAALQALLEGAGT